jgi:hypothetical protein
VFVVRTRSYCPGSGSVLNNINYHVLRPTADPESPRVVLSAEHSYREDRDCRILLQKDSLMMDFPDWSGEGLNVPTCILTYAITKDGARRVEPVAVDPNGFVEQWMMSPWSSASEWTEASSRASWETWHERLDFEKGGHPSVLGDLAFRQICSTDGKLVQITYPADYPTDGPRPGDLFFLVREIGPHQYRLVRIARQSAPGCSKPMPDETQGERLLPASMNRRAERLVPGLP